MSDDLISRQEVIQAIRNERVWVDENIQNPQHHYHIMNETTRILSIIGNLPSVQLKTGRWISIWPLLIAAKCSECKQAFAEKTNFCPNCGAKMEEEEE